MSDTASPTEKQALVAEAIRLEMRTLDVAWFVEDAAGPVDGSRETTPYMLLAEKALAAAGR
jgi:hypothetical protein